MKPIPQEWIKEYVDKLIEVAKAFDHKSDMHKAVLLRADYAMDLVKSFRESERLKEDHERDR
jgi:hypothetical protein